MNKEKAESIHVVCFGDSLTEGYQSSCVLRGEPYTPYGMFLEELLRDKGKVWIRGICGETTEDMLLRYSSDVLDLEPHYVVILGGTNDLGWGIPPRQVAENLSDMYSQALIHGIKPVGISVPSVGGLGGQPALENQYVKAIQERLELNTALKNICAGKHIPLIDLFFATCEQDSKELASVYSEDGLHLTTLGYRKIADMLWREVFQNL